MGTRETGSSHRATNWFHGKFCSLCQPPMSPLARGIQIIEACNCSFWDHGDVAAHPLRPVARQGFRQGSERLTTWFLPFGLCRSGGACFHYPSPGDPIRTTFQSSGRVADHPFPIRTTLFRCTCNSEFRHAASKDNRPPKPTAGVADLVQ